MSMESRASSSVKSRRRGRSRDKKVRDEIPGGSERSLYITNISPHISTSHLKEIFEKNGIVESFQIIQHPITRQSRGFGFALFVHPEDATQAIKNLNGKEIEGRRIRVERSKRDRPHDPTPGFYRGPPGASVKYDPKGKLRPGYLPYYEVKSFRNGRSIDRERGYSRRSRSYPYSPRRPSHHMQEYDSHYIRRSLSPYSRHREAHRDSYPRYRSRSREMPRVSSRVPRDYYYDRSRSRHRYARKIQHPKI